jgi:hypothetical protein
VGSIATTGAASRRPGPAAGRAGHPTGGETAVPGAVGQPDGAIAARNVSARPAAGISEAPAPVEPAGWAAWAGPAVGTDDPAVVAAVAVAGSPHSGG